MPPNTKAMNQISQVFADFKPYEGFDMGLLNNPLFYTANTNGCPECDKGYKGRIGLYEILLMNEELRQGILDGLPGFQLQKLAEKNGMITLEQDGLIKAIQGHTSIEEVYKLVKK